MAKLILMADTFRGAIDDVEFARPYEIHGYIFVRKNVFGEGVDVGYHRSVHVGESTQTVDSLPGEDRAIERKFLCDPKNDVIAYHSHPIEGYSSGDRDQMIELARQGHPYSIIFSPRNVYLFKTENGRIREIEIPSEECEIVHLNQQPTDMQERIVTERRKLEKLLA